MKEEVKGIKRYLSVYPIAPGSNHQLYSYELKPIKISFLHKTFDIDPLERDPSVYDLIDDYIVNETQGKALHPYIIGDAVLDFKKYDYMLETYDVATCTHSAEYLKALEEKKLSS